MREFKLTEIKQQELKTYTIVVDGEGGNFTCQRVWDVYTDNPYSFMNIVFTVGKDGLVVDISVQVNDL